MSHRTALLLPGWLDDIGLPQYKDMFYDARVDGRMLHYLTVVRVCVCVYTWIGYMLAWAHL